MPTPDPSWPDRGVVLAVGPSGSGKGTIARHLLAAGAVRGHLSMGDLLREAVAGAAEPNERARLEQALGSDPPPEAAGLDRVGWLARCVASGLLAPDAWTRAALAWRLERRPELRASRWLLDGYPRRPSAAAALLDDLARLDVPVWRVLVLELGDAEAQRRLLARGRPDDTPDAIRRRLAYYREETRRAVELLRGRLEPGRVVAVDAATPGLDGGAAAAELGRRALAALEG